MTKRRKATWADDSGIAIGPILFIIAVLGLLAAAIAAASGSFSTNTSKESSRVMASTVMDYMQQVDFGVALVLGHGYSEEEISFELPSGPLTEWEGGDWALETVNSNCSVNECKVYYSGGGGIIPRAMPLAVFDSDILTAQGCMPAGGYFDACVVAWPYQVGISGLGATSRSELALLIPAISKKVCIKINEIAGVDNPGGDPPIIADGMQSWGNSHFKGTYDFVPTAGNLIGDANAELVSKKDFCYSDASHPAHGYIYAHVVIVR
jgi:hypothetical protein